MAGNCACPTFCVRAIGCPAVVGLVQAAFVTQYGRCSINRRVRDQGNFAMEFDIHLLTSANSELLNRIGPKVFDNPIDAFQLRAFIDDARHVMLLAVDDGTVVGMASAVEYFHPDKQPQLWINEVGVASTHRRQGIGRRLVEALVRIAEERVCIFAWLGTDVENIAAQACFKSVPDVEEPQPFLLYEWDIED